MKLDLEKYFGLELKELNIDKIQGLPIYMSSARIIRKYEVNHHVFIVVEIKKEEKYGVPALKKQLQKYQEATQLDVVFSFEEMTLVQRNALVKANIPFAALPEQLYIPFLGMLFLNKFYEKKNIKMDKMMPATQQVFLYLLYNKSKNPIMKSTVAEEVGLTRTSLTRATDQLIEMKLITQEKQGREIYIRCVEQDRKLYELAKPFLINPIQKEIVVEKSQISQSMLKAGETALAEQTMLNIPAISEYAIYKGTKGIKDVTIADAQWEDNNNLIKVQLWKYDPYLFSKKEFVDPISLICSFENNEDERIEIQIDEFLEEIKW